MDELFLVIVVMFVLEGFVVFKDFLIVLFFVFRLIIDNIFLCDWIFKFDVLLIIIFCFLFVGVFCWFFFCFYVGFLLLYVVIFSLF